MSNWRVEQVFDDLKSGRIDEYDAKSELRRIDNSLCMRDSVDKIIRDVDYGFRDSYDAARDFEREQRNCEYRRREREEERDY